MKKYEKAEEKRKREAEEKRRYLEGIKRFQKVGVTVLVDGKEPGPQDLEENRRDPGRAGFLYGRLHCR